MILNKNRNFFDIIAKVLPGDTFAPVIFIICQDYVLWTSIDLIKNGFVLKKKKRIKDKQEAKNIPEKLWQT